jgi:PAS domain S-box-containing protein
VNENSIRVHEKEHEMLTLFFEEFADLCCIVDLVDGKFERVNHDWTSILGWQKKDVLDKSSGDFINPEDLHKDVFGAPSTS